MDKIDSCETLRERYGKPGDLAVACMKDTLDDYHRQFIALSPLICLATADSDGQPFVSPRGDAPGFVRVVDERRLALPDRRGNNKVESFVNIVGNPKVAIIFFVPGLPETLRVRGTAVLSTDDALLREHAVHGKPAESVLLFDIDTVYFHCGKALVRSKAWNAERHVARDAFPPFGRVIKEQARLTASEDEAQALVDEMYTSGLY